METFSKKLVIYECCAESGATAKLFGVLRSVANGSGERTIDDTCAAERMQPPASDRCDKGGPGATRAERLFPGGGGWGGMELGLMTPYSREVRQTQHMCLFRFSPLLC